jgi:hypothetical protein
MVFDWHRGCKGCLYDPLFERHYTSDGWQIISISRRFRSLPEKFNALAGLAQGDILVVWEDATGRFHASLAFRREAFERIGGWPLTKRGDFDQQLIARLTAIEAPGDPCQLDSPSSIFRWGQTNAYHGQAFPCSVQSADIGPTASPFSEKHHTVAIDSSRLG